MFAFFKKLFGRADVNKDGKVDGKDAVVAAKSVAAGVKAGTIRTRNTLKKASVKAKAARNKKTDAK